MNPHDTTIAAIQQQIQAQQAAMAEASRLKLAQEARLADWLRDYRGPGSSAEADAAIADARAWIVQHDQQIANARRNIETLTAQLVAAQEAKAAYDAAMTQAASEGLVGAAAEARAKALVEEAKARRNLYTIGAIVAGVITIIALIVYLRRRRKAGAPAPAA